MVSAWKGGLLTGAERSQLLLELHKVLLRVLGRLEGTSYLPKAA